MRKRGSLRDREWFQTHIQQPDHRPKSASATYSLYDLPPWGLGFLTSKVEITVPACRVVVRTERVFICKVLRIAPGMHYECGSYYYLHFIDHKTKQRFLGVYSAPGTGGEAGTAPRCIRHKSSALSPSGQCCRTRDQHDWGLDVNQRLRGME